MPSNYPKTFQKLIENFSSLPSIGPKLAERLVFHLFKEKKETLAAFAENLSALQDLKSCQRCFNIAEEKLCGICQDSRRDSSVVCVVENPLDVIAIEKTGIYKGIYHVLGGLLGSATARQEENLKIKELLARIKKENIQEVIIATNPTTEGDLTALYLKRKLQPFSIKITRLGRGLSTGGDIEYADEITLSSSISHRQEI